MDDGNIRTELSKISKVMDSFSLETVKIASIQTELCTIKKENTVLKENVAVLKENVTVLNERVNLLENENTTLKGKVETLSSENTTLKAKVETLSSENTTLKGKVETLSSEVKTLSHGNAVLRNLNKTVMEKFSQVCEENKVLKTCYDALRSDVDMLKTASKAPQVESESVAGGDKVPIDREANSDGACDDGAKSELDRNPVMGRKPKAQKKREQNETFRNWQKLMAQRKTPQHLWASGLIKISIELWEEENNFLNGDQIFDLIKRNVDRLTAFISNEESKKTFFLTLIKMCAMRKVTESKFREIMLCFENQGPRKCRIIDAEIQKFIKMYEEYKV